MEVVMELNMKKIILYHGSPKIIENPLFGEGKTYNDYGQGFYCTEYLELAKEWACTNDNKGYANKYELNLDELKILDLSNEKYTILNIYFPFYSIILPYKLQKVNKKIIYTKNAEKNNLQHQKHHKSFISAFLLYEKTSK